MYNTNPYLNPNFYPQQNYLPSQQILQVNGKEGLSNMKLAPNSSVLVVDNSLPLIYKCVSDSLGNVQTTTYDVSVHKEVEEIKMDTIEQRMTFLEQQINELRNMVQPINDGFISA